MLIWRIVQFLLHSQGSCRSLEHCTFASISELLLAVRGVAEKFHGRSQIRMVKFRVKVVLYTYMYVKNKNRVIHSSTHFPIILMHFSLYSSKGAIQGAYHVDPDNCIARFVTRGDCWVDHFEDEYNILCTCIYCCGIFQRPNSRDLLVYVYIHVGWSRIS